MSDTIDDQIARAAQSGPVSGGTTQMFAFLGTTARTARGAQSTADMKDAPPHSMFGATNDILDVDSAMLRIRNWSDKQFDDWAKILVENGMLKPGTFNRADLIEQWEAAVIESSKFHAAGKNVTPQDYVRIYSGMNGLADPANQARTVNRTDSTTQDFSEVDARAMANEMYANQLGRDATAHESAALEAALDAYATNHPQVTQSANRYNARGDLVSTKNKTSGGVGDRESRQIAEDQAKSNPDYAEYQAATTYFNALLEAIKAPVDI